jgi:pimeloyl-ACP methyl ester carboxylesterase
MMILLCPSVHAATDPPVTAEPLAGETRTEGTASTAPAESPLRHTASIELADGKLDLGELLAQLAEQSGLDAQGVRANVNWKIDVNAPAGQLTLSGIQSFTRDVVAFDIRDDRLDLTFDQLKLRNEEKQIRRSVLMFLKRVAPDAAARVEARYGFVVHRDDGSAVSPSVENLGEHAVVLVHGLDDPGKVWNVLAPALVEEGYTTCEFFYPNDQAIVSSADLLVEHLATLRTLGVRRVSIVAHSMGGLVSRWALTDTRGYGGQVRGHDHLPDVERLIMIGTPNHGSKMARFRLAGEIREQVERTLSGDGVLFGSIFDGTGEAKLDLLPDSTFLATLSGRLHPADLPITIIAGNTSPVTSTQIQRLKPLIQEKIGPAASQPAGDLFDSLADVSAGMGDGVVSVESARLEGVEDFVIVEANHLTMIRNYATSSTRIPPAVPLVLERLRMSGSVSAAK